MIDSAALYRVHARLAVALAPPSRRYRPLRVDGCVAGWITEARSERLREFREVFCIGADAVTFAGPLDTPAARTSALARVTATLAAEGALTAWRDERYRCAPSFTAPPWFVLERAAARYFGIHTWAAHVNGLVGSDGVTHMWLARRSPHKPIDAGMLDNLVGGGIAADETAAATVWRESWEEAGIADDLARNALPGGTVTLRRDQPDGLHWESIFVHDLWLPRTFVPANQDGEALDHRLVSLPEAARLIALHDGPDQVTVDASLVVLDCLLRLDACGPPSPLRAALSSLGRAGGD